jgi:hypothetical protein
MGRNIELRGDWRKLRHKFDRLTDLGQHMADQSIQKIAERVRDVLHEEVNSSPPPPNAPSTEKRKGHNTPLLETGGMQKDDSVIIEKQDAGDRTAYIVKGNPNKFHDRTGTSYEDILGILEWGDGGAIPPREVMTKTYNRLEHEIEALAIREVQDFMRK